MFKVHINSKPSLTISKSFHFERYNNMSKYLKALYGSQNHARIDSRSKPIIILYNKVTFIPRLKSLISSNKEFPLFKAYINSRPSLTISKSFYFKRYYYMSKHLKTLYESQNHVRINSRNKPIGIFK